MKSLEAIEAELAGLASGSAGAADAPRMLALGEQVLEHWVIARGESPTSDRLEEFRLLALHRQGARRMPSFNACRETCREIAYHYNLLTSEPQDSRAAERARMMALLATHLCLFVGGKLIAEGLGDFCCASRPLRSEAG